MKRLGILLFVITLMSLTGCGNDKNITNISTNDFENIEVTLPGEDNEEVVTETEPVEVEETIEPVETEEVPFDPTGKIFSKLTGLEITEEQSLKRPIAVMLDNQYKARPQAGLSEADVVYEILAEGLITRYMAIFQSNEPEVIGPVRSARPYFIQRALEYNPLYTHVGGSMQALTDIINLNMADIEGLSAGYDVFYRTTHKKMPHNAYSSHDGIRKEANRKNYYREVEFAGLPISYENYQLEGDVANELTIVYKASSAKDRTGYFINYKYNEETKKYERYVNGSAHLDEESEIHLSADNIVIQKVPHKVIDNEGRLEVKMVGSGEGYYINKGVYVPITWKKEGTYNQTEFFTKEGDRLILNPGHTWIQVISTSMEPSID